MLVIRILCWVRSVALFRLIDQLDGDYGAVLYVPSLFGAFLSSDRKAGRHGRVK